MDVCLNTYNDYFGYDLVFMLNSSLTIGSDPPVAKAATEWIQEAMILAHRAGPACINQTSCNQLLEDKELLARANEILEKLAYSIEDFDSSMKCHPDSLGIYQMECFPMNGYWGAQYRYEDQLKLTEFIDMDLNDLVARLYVCIARDYDLTTHALWIESRLVAKGSYYEDQALKITMNGSFSEIFNISYVDTNPLMPNGVQYAVTRVYDQWRLPKMTIWNETTNVITLIANTTDILEPLTNPYPPKSQRIINTNPYIAIRCPRYFMHTVIYPNASAPPPTTTILGAPPIYPNAIRYNQNTSSCIALEERVGNVSAVFNAADFAVSELNLPTGIVMPHTCYPWATERVSQYNAYSGYGAYSNWLLSEGMSYCPEDSSCYYWYDSAIPDLVFEQFFLVDEYGQCF